MQISQPERPYRRGQAGPKTIKVPGLGELSWCIPTTQVTYNRKVYSYHPRDSSSVGQAVCPQEAPGNNWSWPLRSLREEWLSNPQTSLQLLSQPSFLCAYQIIPPTLIRKLLRTRFSSGNLGGAHLRNLHLVTSTKILSPRMAFNHVGPWHRHIILGLSSPGQWEAGRTMGCRIRHSSKEQPPPPASESETEHNR